MNKLVLINMDSNTSLYNYKNMNQNIEGLKENVLQKKHHQFRQKIKKEVLRDFTVSLKAQKLSDIQRSQKRLTWVLEHEIPVILPGEKIVFTRTIPQIPEIFTEEEWAGIKKRHFIHELGRVFNLSSNYSYTIEVGLEQRRKEILQALEIQLSQGNSKGVEFLRAVLQSLDDVINLTDRYAQKAKEAGMEDVYSLLRRIPSVSLL